MTRRPFQPTLSTTITLGAAALVIPALLGILAFSHQRNVDSALAILKEDIDALQEDTSLLIDDLIEPASDIAKIIAEIEATQPNYFKKEESRGTLLKSLTAADHLDAFNITLEDGYHRVFTRIDEQRRQANPNIPKSANWYSGYIESFTDGTSQTPRKRYQSYFQAWPNRLGQYTETETDDTRTYPHYQQAKSRRGLVISDPISDPDTGKLSITVGYPVLADGKFMGAVGVSITLDKLSQFLSKNSTSPNSLAIIAHKDGRIIAHPDYRQVANKQNSKSDLASIDKLEDRLVNEAVRHHKRTEEKEFTIKTSTGEEITASFQDFGPTWQFISITPTNDIIGPIKSTDQAIAILIAVLVTIELALIYTFSRSLSRGVESATKELHAIETLDFESKDNSSSRIKEFADLKTGISLLRNTLQTFSQYVPINLVRQLVESRQPLTLGMRQKELTIFFSDLVDFSNYAETANPEVLMQQMSNYFSAVTEAITHEEGTIDKFIGDAVMAFWGAPLSVENHILRGCAGALRASRRMQKLNSSWAQEDKPPLRIRIGIHTAEVLVGNAGSSDRISYTVMGHGVNVAARLEAKNKEFQSSICISDTIFAAMSNQIVARPLGQVEVKGRSGAFPVYELLGLKNSADPELMPRPGDQDKAEWATRAERAIAEGDLTSARAAYMESIQRHPDDVVAQRLLARLEDRSKGSPS